MASDGGDRIKVASLYRYPVKGLSPQRLQQVTLAAGETFPLDRAWAIENGAGRFDEANPKHLPKITFLMLMRNERLATLDCRFDEDSSTLAIWRGGNEIAKGDLRTKVGRSVLEQFFAAYTQADLRGPPRIVSASGHSFTDTAVKTVHLINLASVRELERVAGRPIDPLRFRPNIVVAGAKPWEEFDWVNREIVASNARFRVMERTDRCAATNVDPTTGARDMDIPAQLARVWGHTDFGVYAQIERGGHLQAGDALAIEARAAERSPA